MIIILLTPVMLATAPLILNSPPNTYSHVTQTMNGVRLAQSTTTATGTQHNTTMPTVGTNTCNEADGCPSGHDTDLGGGDSTVADPDSD
jgi:hypothetical protein